MSSTNGTVVSRPSEAACSGEESIEKAISKHPFLEGMSPHQLALVRDFAIRVHFTRDEMIFREGDPATRFYLLQNGRVALESFVVNRGKVVIDTLHGGEVLGWSWLFPPHLWHFDARASGTYRRPFYLRPSAAGRV